MKKALLFLTIFFLAVQGCGPLLPEPVASSTATATAELPSATPGPVSETAIPTEEAPGESPTPPDNAFDGTPVFFGPLSLVLPAGLASGISGEQFPRVGEDEGGPWGVNPGHTEIHLEGYLLQGKFHKPVIYIYPAASYTEMNPGASESLQRLDNIINGSGEPSGEQLPFVPFFNAGQIFASNIKLLDFQGGRGVRFATEYSQYTAPVNNNELFYHFQGLSTDGAYYIIAIFPITAPVLAETSDIGAVVPSGGVPFPNIDDANADFQSYYAAITELLNATAPEAFSPAIGTLDRLIQSMQARP